MRPRSPVVSLAATMPVPLPGASVAGLLRWPAAVEYAEPQKGRPGKTRTRRIRSGSWLSSAGMTGKLKRCQAGSETERRSREAARGREAMSATRGEHTPENIAPFRTSFLPTSLVVLVRWQPGQERKNLEEKVDGNRDGVGNTARSRGAGDCRRTRRRKQDDRLVGPLEGDFARDPRGGPV